MKTKRFALQLLLIIGLIAGLASLPSSSAKAACALCMTDVGIPFQAQWWPIDTEKPIKDYITNSFEKHREWLETTLWDGKILPAMRDMADELSAVGIYQTYIIGLYFDSKQQLEAQQAIQKVRARANKDYHPSTGMCKFGSVVKGLAASEAKAAANAAALAKAQQQRALGAVGTPGASGDSADKQARINNFKNNYCNPNDYNSSLSLICPSGASTLRRNKDVDYTRTFASGVSMADVDFTDGGSGDNEQDVMSLSDNLYGHYIAVPPPGAINDQPSGEVTDKQKHYMNLRAIQAKRSVAQDSFNTILGMRGAGAAGSAQYMNGVMKELGVDPTDSAAILGGNPSYEAQMEVLTKKIFQNPDFYTGLYDKPANVQRKHVALQAIGLMQKFDLYKSYLRNEASLAVLLETSLISLQGAIENEPVQ